MTLRELLNTMAEDGWSDNARWRLLSIILSEFADALGVDLDYDSDKLRELKKV